MLLHELIGELQHIIRTYGDMEVKIGHSFAIGLDGSPESLRIEDSPEIMVASVERTKNGEFSHLTSLYADPDAETYTATVIIAD